jgi:hypothetical protein
MKALWRCRTKICHSDKTKEETLSGLGHKIKQDFIGLLDL